MQLTMSTGVGLWVCLLNVDHLGGVRGFNVQESKSTGVKGGGEKEGKLWFVINHHQRNNDLMINFIYYNNINDIIIIKYTRQIK